MNAASQQREEARRHLREEPHNINLPKAVKMAGKNLWKDRKAGPCRASSGTLSANSTHALEKATRSASPSI